MARGKNFNHKRKGHPNKLPKTAPDAEFANEPLANEGDRPVPVNEVKKQQSE